MREYLFQVFIEDKGASHAHAIYHIPTQSEKAEPVTVYFLTLSWAEDAPSTTEQYLALVRNMRDIETQYSSIRNILNTAPIPDTFSGTPLTVLRIQRRSVLRLATRLYNLCYEHNLWAKEAYELELCARHRLGESLSTDEINLLYDICKNDKEQP